MQNLFCAEYLNILLRIPQNSAWNFLTTGGRACVPEKWAVLPSAQIQPKLSLGGRAHGGSGGTFPSQIEGPGAWNSRWISPMTYAEGGREGREGTFP